MAGSKFRVEQLGEGWAVYQEVTGAAAKLPGRFRSKDEAISVALAAAEEFHRNTKQSAEIWIKEQGRYVRYGHSFGLKP